MGMPARKKIKWISGGEAKVPTINVGMPTASVGIGSRKKKRLTGYEKISDH